MSKEISNEGEYRIVLAGPGGMTIVDGIKPRKIRTIEGITLIEGQEVVTRIGRVKPDPRQSKMKLGL